MAPERRVVVLRSEARRSVNKACAVSRDVEEQVLFVFVAALGADVNVETCDGVTALHEASRHGHREAAAMLLERNADANKPCGSGLLPLHTAAEHGHQE